jgi:hypothetical protein
MDETQEITSQIIGNIDVLSQMHMDVTRAFASFLLSVGQVEGETPDEKLENLLAGLEQATAGAQDLLQDFVALYDDTAELKAQLES